MIITCLRQKPIARPEDLPPALLMAMESSLPTHSAFSPPSLQLSSERCPWGLELLPGAREDPQSNMKSSYSWLLANSQANKPGHGRHSKKHSPQPGHLAPLCLTEAHASYCRDMKTLGSVCWEQLRPLLMRSISWHPPGPASLQPIFPAPPLPIQPLPADKSPQGSRVHLQPDQPAAFSLQASPTCFTQYSPQPAYQTITFS